MSQQVRCPDERRRLTSTSPRLSGPGSVLGDSRETELRVSQSVLSFSCRLGPGQCVVLSLPERSVQEFLFSSQEQVCLSSLEDLVT